jgi:hypothetical protein
MAVVSAVAGVASLAVSLKEGRRIRRAQAEDRRLAQEQAQVARRRERAQALAVAARQRASITAQAVNQGVGAGSTAVSQAKGALVSQLNSNFGFTETLQQLGDQRFAAQERTARAAGRAQTFQAVAGAIQGVAGALDKPKPPSIPAPPGGA